MIYLSPLLLVGTGMVLESRRVDWRVVAVASAFVLFLVLDKPANLSFPYFEAPGFAILDLFTREFGGRSRTFIASRSGCSVLAWWQSGCGVSGVWPSSRPSSSPAG